MNEWQCCGSCEYYEEYEGVCCNGVSEHVADFMDQESYCEKWREKSETGKTEGQF